MPVALKALTWIALIALIGGLSVAIWTYASWPAYSSIQHASNIATVLQMDITEIDPSTLSDPEIPRRVPVITASIALAVFGAFAGLLALHASAVRPRH